MLFLLYSIENYLHCRLINFINLYKLSQKTVDCYGFNADFNNSSVTPRRPLDVSMCFLALSKNWVLNFIRNLCSRAFVKHCGNCLLHHNSTSMCTIVTIYFLGHFKIRHLYAYDINSLMDNFIKLFHNKYADDGGIAFLYTLTTAGYDFFIR